MLPYIDLHCDTLYRIAASPERFFATGSDVSTHIFHSGLRYANCALQSFAIFTDLYEFPGTHPLSSFRKQYQCFRSILANTEEQMMQICSSSDLTDCIHQNKTGALLTLEESCLCKDPIALLPCLFSLGIRIATLTWDYSTPLCCSAANKIPTNLRYMPPFPSAHTGLFQKNFGLTPYGLDFLAEAERLGIILDVSHLSDKGFFDLAAHSKRPFLASHSNARSVCNIPRNLSDDMLRILAERGGLTGLCLHEPFLMTNPCSDRDMSDALIHHVKHILNIAGSDVLALGTDFDGTPGNRIIPNVTHLFHLEHILKKAGIGSDGIEKLFYKNALHFFKENLP